MALYVDGVKVASDSSVTTAHSYTSDWRVGGDSLTGWTNQPSSYYFAGTIDDVALYPRALVEPKVLAHYRASGGSVANQASTASFTESTDG